MSPAQWRAADWPVQWRAADGLHPYRLEILRGDRVLARIRNNSGTNIELLKKDRKTGNQLTAANAKQTTLMYAVGRLGTRTLQLLPMTCGRIDVHGYLGGRYVCAARVLLASAHAVANQYKPASFLARSRSREIHCIERFGFKIAQNEQ